MKSMFPGMGSHKTFKPAKKPQKEPQKQLKVQMEATLGAGADLRTAVKLPIGADMNEWLAMNAFDCFNEVSLLYGTVVECCTDKSCPKMTAGRDFTYKWADGVKIKKPISVSAPQYIDLLMTWVQEQLDDEEIFPLDMGHAFPKNFMNIVKTIFKRLFRIYAHLYHHHFKEIADLGAEPHLNTCFKHLIFLIHEFNLVKAEELKPLESLIAKVMPVCPEITPVHNGQ